METRLCLLYDGLKAELERHRPSVVAIEDIFHAQNARSALVLGQARGIALLVAAQFGAEVRSFPPATVKQAVTGSGRAEKGQVARMVETLLGIRVVGRVDASDALAVALCGVLRAPVATALSKPAPGRETSSGLLARLLSEGRGGKAPAKPRVRTMRRGRSTR